MASALTAHKLAVSLHPATGSYRGEVAGCAVPIWLEAKSSFREKLPAWSKGEVRAEEPVRERKRSRNCAARLVASFMIHGLP